MSEDEKKDLCKLLEVQLFGLALTLLYLVKFRFLKEAKQLSTNLLNKIIKTNKRHLDSLQAFCLFYYSRVNELSGHLRQIRPQLFDYYRRACIKTDEIGQATVINLILRNFIEFQQFSQAEKFMNQSSFPETISNNENVRYLYYTALIKTTSLEY